MISEPKDERTAHRIKNQREAISTNSVSNNAQSRINSV